MNRPGSESTDLRVGQRVMACRDEPPRGSWSKYSGKIGTVSALNRDVFPDGSKYVEVGVSFGYAARPGKGGAKKTVWFRADELVRV